MIVWVLTLVADRKHKNSKKAKGRCAVKIDFSDDPALAAEITGIAAFCGESSEEVVRQAVMLGLREMGRKLSLTVGPPTKGTAPTEPEGGISITAGRVVINLPEGSPPDRIVAVARALGEPKLI